ncbi:MAG TPA: hypothetical protein DD400_05970 [Rhodospirillaceae bacterium]|nr:hypothetical protein [Rhodospirillaceae bacterium]
MTNKNSTKRRTIEALKEHMNQVADSLKVSSPMVSPSFSDKIPVAQVERINERELTSIYALLAYVSYNQNVRQETVQTILETEFRVDNVAKISRNDYMRAIEFLVDVKTDEIIN